eukprot:TRINITY_DN687_c2_g2_i2.p1 TRINITY_DN687_c2_g2~~TRINITY_DN687_c2_g2_i2.p1  ORF type:complete len:333 (-),score=35.13 TRINITY_DN687_c2_g2_i2:220-1218(-)
MQQLKLKLQQLHPSFAYPQRFRHVSSSNKYLNVSKRRQIVYSSQVESLSYEEVEQQVQEYEQFIMETTQPILLRRNLICYMAVAGVLILRSLFMLAFKIQLFPNLGLILGFVTQQLQTGMAQLVQPTFGPPCIAAFGFFRWKFRHEMETAYLGSFARILETTQKVGIKHEAKIAWEKLLVSQWLIKYGLGWALVAFQITLFITTQLTNFLSADVAASISIWMSQPLLSKGVTVGWMAGMMSLWLCSAFVGYVVMGDLINMCSYTILKLCMKFDPIDKKGEDEEEEEEEEEEVEGQQSSNKQSVGQNGLSQMKVIELDKDSFRSVDSQSKNQN